MIVFGEELYPSVYDKAAAYLFNIVCNHPFNDGNKRTGAGSAYLFLQLNKVPIRFDPGPKDTTCKQLLPKGRSFMVST